MKTNSVYHRWYNAFQAHQRARNQQFKDYWYGVMQHLQKEF